MQGQINIFDWNDAQEIAEIMIDNGYQVALYWTGELIEGKKQYTLEYIHPLHDGVTFQVPSLKCDDGACKVKPEQDLDSYYELENVLVGKKPGRGGSTGE